MLLYLGLTSIHLKQYCGYEYLIFEDTTSLHAKLHCTEWFKSGIKIDVQILNHCKNKCLYITLFSVHLEQHLINTQLMLMVKH